MRLALVQVRVIGHQVFRWLLREEVSGPALWGGPQPGLQHPRMLGPHHLPWLNDCVGPTALPLPRIGTESGARDPGGLKRGDRDLGGQRSEEDQGPPLLSYSPEPPHAHTHTHACVPPSSSHTPLLVTLMHMATRSLRHPHTHNPTCGLTLIAPTHPDAGACTLFLSHTSSHPLRSHPPHRDLVHSAHAHTHLLDTHMTPRSSHQHAH